MSKNPDDDWHKITIFIGEIAGKADTNVNDRAVVFVCLQLAKYTAVN